MFFSKPVHDVLLADLQDIVCEPVQDKPTGEIHEKDGHDDRHDHHHPLLGRIGGGGRHLLADVLRDSHQDGRHIDRVVRRKIPYPKDEGALPEF